MNTCADCSRNYDLDEWDGQQPCPSDDCPSHSVAMAPETLDSIYNANGDGEHPKYLREHWVAAVGSGRTSSGYWEWVSRMLSHADKADTGRRTLWTPWVVNPLAAVYQVAETNDIDRTAVDTVLLKAAKWDSFDSECFLDDLLQEIAGATHIVVEYSGEKNQFRAALSH